ncbi:MAG: YihY/virulence factor BrkB family protein [Polyangiaceae bacterium]|nr:YihY/virulence factor BrkB family protein [Polyangiaceae bacterium]
MSEPSIRARDAAAFVRALAVRLLDHDAPRAASAIAFDAFLSVIPLLAVAGWAISKLDSPADVVLGAVLDAAAPPVRDLVRAELPRLVRGSAAIPPVSALVFLWVTSSGLSAAIAELSQVFGAPPPPFWRRRLLAIGWVIGGVASIAVLGAVTLALSRLVGGGQFFTTLLPPIFVVAALSLFFRTAAQRRRAVVLPGAVATLGLWVALSYGFAFYVRNLARYATLYGGLAAVAMTMLWLWLLMFAVLIGAETNAMLEERLRADVSGGPRATG